MGSEREHRALGAGESITVEGKDFLLRPVVARNLAELEREALKFYKRQYLETFRDNMDLLGDQGKNLMMSKMEEVARWTASDLPQRDAFNCLEVPVTDKVKKWIEKEYGEVPKQLDSEEVNEVGCRALLSTALDNKELTPNQVKEMSGRRPRQGKVRFDQWWVTASVEGMVSIIRSALRDASDKEKARVNEWPFLKLVEASRIVERITSADLGNG